MHLLPGQEERDLVISDTISIVSPSMNYPASPAVKIAGGFCYLVSAEGARVTGLRIGTKLILLFEKGQKTTASARWRYSRIVGVVAHEFANAEDFSCYTLNPEWLSRFRSKIPLLEAQLELVLRD